MKKLTLLLLLMVSTNVLAEWTKVGENSEKTFYINYETIRNIENNNVKLWGLNDFKTERTIETEGKHFLSSKYHMRFNCNNETYSLLDIVFYSKNMGQGDLVHRVFNNFYEMSVEPDSNDETLFKIACGKK